MTPFITAETISMYVIYDHPIDFPNKFVVRRWDIVPSVPAPIPNGNPILTDTIEAARLKIPTGCVRIRPDEEDDPKVAEIWF